MIFSKSVLPVVTSRWSYSLATTTGRQFDIAPGGWVKTTLTVEDMPVLPGIMRLNIVADRYAGLTSYETVVDILIENKDGRNYNIVVPIVNTGKNMYSVDIDFTNSEYKTFSFTIKSKLGIKITLCELLTPAGADNTAIIEELRGELPRLLYDYNKTPLVVDYKEQTIALISAWLVRDTDLNGHIQLTYTATHETQLIIRCKDNDISELFAPILYDIKSGRGSIGIPHAYLEKKIGFHTFTVSAQVKEGSITFATRAIIYTIDGGHLASRVMDVGMDVRDIVVRRTKTEEDPSYIYAIGIDKGIASVRARSHNEIASIAWEPKLIVGEAKDAAITFNGDWAQDENGWRLNTDDEPWIFWVDAENILWAQYFDNEATKIQLATDVIDVSVVMGWRNPVLIEQDQGMIATYVKSDGTAWYRNYCIQASAVKVWELERQLTQFDGVAENVHVFRTNDYRLGIRIQNTVGVSTTLLTYRNWAGMAIAADKILGKSNIKIDFLEITKYEAFEDEKIVSGINMDVSLLYASSFNKFVGIENIDDGEGDFGKEIIFTALHEIYDFDARDFELKDNRDIGFLILDIVKIGNRQYKLILLNFNNAEGEVTLRFKGLYGKNEADSIYDEFEGTFIPTGLVPIEIPIPTVEAIWNE